MANKDPAHWLYRLTPDEWLRAAEAELGRAERALGARQYRAGVTQSLRAAGMAWNAVLAATSDETTYGRSYRQHLDALACDPTVPESVRVSARAIIQAPLTAPLVMLGAGDTTLAKHAAIIIEHAGARLAPTTSA